jgi:hypothetical protein
MRGNSNEDLIKQARIILREFSVLTRLSRAKVAYLLTCGQLV